MLDLFSTFSSEETSLIKGWKLKQDKNVYNSIFLFIIIISNVIINQSIFGTSVALLFGIFLCLQNIADS